MLGEVGQQPGQRRVGRGVAGAERGAGHPAAVQDDRVGERAEQRALAQARVGADRDELRAAAAGHPLARREELGEPAAPAVQAAGEGQPVRHVRGPDRKPFDGTGRGQLVGAAAQVGQYPVGALVPVLRQGGEQRGHEPGDPGRYRAGRRRCGTGQLRPDQFGRPGGAERQLAGGQLVQDHAQRVQVGALVDVAGQPAALFRSGVGRAVGGRPVPVEERDLPVGLDAYRLGAQPAVRAGAPVPADEGGGQPLGEAQQSPGGYRCTTGGAQRPVACRRRGAGPGLAWHPRPLAPGCGRRGLAVVGYRASWLGCGQVFQRLRDRATAQTVSIGHVRRCHMHGASDTATSAAIRPRVPGVQDLTVHIGRARATYHGAMSKRLWRYLTVVGGRFLTPCSRVSGHVLLEIERDGHRAKVAVPGGIRSVAFAWTEASWPCRG